MRIIKLMESQFKRLFEGNGDSIYLDGNDTTKRFSSEVGNQALVQNGNGKKETSKPIMTKVFGDEQTPQQWGSVGGRNSSNTI
jgi:hypothetical protein